MQWLDDHIRQTVDHMIYLRKMDREYAIYALKAYKNECANPDKPWTKLIEPEELDRLIKEKWNAANPETTVPEQQIDAKQKERAALDDHAKRQGRSPYSGLQGR